jgi:hypothetical protein
VRLLVVQWLGDSLDGTLARVRGIERPTYGYYLDHLVDAIATAAIGIGLSYFSCLRRIFPEADFGICSIRSIRRIFFCGETLSAT